jgi:hypothetical protein
MTDKLKSFIPSQRKADGDVHRLKQQWLADPCWLIEQTPGFENYRAYLLAFRLRHQAAWEAKQRTQAAELDAEADRLGVRGLLRMVQQLQKDKLRLEAVVEELCVDHPNAHDLLTRLYSRKLCNGG